MEYSTISISGADRISFLQGQLTQDVERITHENGLQAAWCNAKGRVLVTCRVFAAGDEHVLALPSSSAEVVLNKLLMYRLRANVQLELTDLYQFVSVPAEQALSPLKGIARLALPFVTDFVELFSTTSALHASGIDQASILSNDAWATARCAAGLVDIDTRNAEKYTPHMLNLDRTGAVSFSKGCYTGQEIVARTENIGRVKRRVNRYRVHGAAPVVGDTVTDQDETVGHVVNVAGDEVLALVSTDRHADELETNACRLSPAALPYTL